MRKELQADAHKYKLMSVPEFVCKVNDIFKIQTQNIYKLKDICYDYKKADLLSILISDPIKTILLDI